MPNPEDNSIWRDTDSGLRYQISSSNSVMVFYREVGDLNAPIAGMRADLWPGSMVPA